MRLTAQIVLGAVTIVAVAAACGETPSSERTIDCVSVAPPNLLYPAPSSTAQPDGDLDIWVGYPSNPWPQFSGPTLNATGKPSVTGPAWLPPSPSPTNPPGMAPLPTGDLPFISGIPSLASATTYTVSVRNTDCNHTYTIGSFTTR